MRPWKVCCDDPEIPGAGAADPNGDGAGAEAPPNGDSDIIPDEPKGVCVAGALPKGVADDNPPMPDDPKGEGDGARPPNAGAAALDPKVDVDDPEALDPKAEGAVED